MTPDPNNGPGELALHGGLSANVVGFCRILRSAGAGVGPAEATDALLALATIDLGNADHFYQALRTCLAKNQTEQDIFAAHFDSYWRVWDRADELLRRPSDPQEEEENKDIRHPYAPEQQPALKAITAWLKGEESPEEEEQAAGYSPFEVLAQRDFAGFRADELDEIGRLVTLIARLLAKRFNRRYRDSARRGQLDIRRTLRRNLRRGGELLDLTYRQRQRQRLKLVLLCDVSRSMDLYSNFLIQFVYAFQCAYRRVETFAFSTSLQRITESLTSENLDEVLLALSRNVPQWSGGTRIGASLQSFVDDFGHDLLDNQTAVVVLSDGWDTGDPDVLCDAMHAIHRRSLAVVWLNPLLGSEEYRPDTRGMRAALPHVDVFAPAHNAASLKDLAGILGRIFARNMPNRFGICNHDESGFHVDVDSDPQPDLQRPTSADNLKKLAKEMHQKRELARRKDHLTP